MLVKRFHRFLSTICCLAWLAAGIGCADTRSKQKLVFKASPLPSSAVKSIDLEPVKTIVKGRLRGAGLKSSFQVESSGLNRLTVTVRGADQQALDKIKEYVTEWGMLEFAAVARSDENAELLALAKDADREVNVDGDVRAEWLPVSKDQRGRLRQGMEVATDVATRQREVNGEEVTEWLVLYDPEGRITGDMLADATASYDETGQPAILFKLNEVGAANMSVLTTEIRPLGATTYRLAIILNGQIYSAPTVQSPISSRGQITGFTKEEVERTVQVLRSGKLPCQLTFVELIDESDGQK